MAVPSFEKFLYPFLYCLKDGDVTLKDLRTKLTEYFGLTPADLLLRTKSGNSTQVNDRINWARQYFRRALFIEIPQNGTYRITERGMEVVSPKLDTKHDLLEIKRLIEQEYENYVYQYLTLTYQNQSIQRKDRSEDDVWMSIFQQIVEKYVKAVRYIIEHSNKHSVQKVYYQKPDRIKRWGVHELEIMYNRGKDADKYYYRNQVSEQTINTRENRFVKHTLLKIEGRLTHVFADIKKKYKDSISAEYEQMINSYCDTFRTLRHSQFFRAIGPFEGQMQESQVLQQRAGYRNVYVYWQVLKSVVELENGSTQIGVRQI